jgi:hypothetical protein
MPLLVRLTDSEIDAFESVIPKLSHRIENERVILE